MQNLHNLAVYREAKELAAHVYVLTADLPREERFGLVQQMRRAAISVGSNIAEGCGRTGHRDFSSFLAIALGSSRELEFQLEMCQRLELGCAARISSALDSASRVQRMLASLIVKVRARIP